MYLRIISPLVASQSRVPVCRVGDTYPNQLLEITARMYLYRWATATNGDRSGEPFTQHMLEVREGAGKNTAVCRHEMDR
jgi:hypothetical protein